MFAVCLPERRQLSDAFGEIVLVHSVVAVEGEKVEGVELLTGQGSQARQRAYSSGAPTPSGAQGSLIQQPLRRSPCTVRSK